MIDSTQSVVHQGSMIVLGAVLAILLIGTVRPQIFKRVLQEFSERKYIIGGSVFVSLLSATVFVATQPAGKTFVSDTTRQGPNTVLPLNQSQNADQEPIKTEDIQVIEIIAYSKQWQDDPLLPVKQTRILQPGKDGEKQLIYTVTYKGSEEVSRVLKEERVLTEPAAEVTAVGSQPPLTNNPVQPKADNSRPLLKLSCDNKKQSKTDKNRPLVCLLRD